jgi:hypothetical protein
VNYEAVTGKKHKLPHFQSFFKVNTQTAGAATDRAITIKRRLTLTVYFFFLLKCSIQRVATFLLGTQKSRTFRNESIVSVGFPTLLFFLNNPPIIIFS